MAVINEGEASARCIYLGKTGLYIIVLEIGLNGITILTFHGLGQYSKN